MVGLMRGHSQKGRQSYRNPFDIPRHCLLDQVVRMRANFLQPALAHTKLIDDGKRVFSVLLNFGNFVKILASVLLVSWN